MISAWEIIVNHEVVFSHESEDGTQRIFAVDRIAEAAKDLEVVDVPIEREFALFCLQRRGVEGHRLLQLQHVPAANLPPIIFCHFPEDNTHLLVDGTHRYVEMARRKEATIRAQVVPKEIWEQHLVELPAEGFDNLLNGPSGL